MVNGISKHLQLPLGPKIGAIDTMLSHSSRTTLHSTVLSPNNTNTVNTPTSIDLPLRKPQLPSLTPTPIQIPAKPTTITTNRKKNSNLDVIRLMDALNHPIPLDLYSSFLAECTRNSDSIEALQLHNRLIRRRDLRFDSPIAHRLLYMHVACGQLDVARYLFDRMPLRKDVLSWAIIITGYLDNSRHEEGIRLFVEMLLNHNVCDALSDVPNYSVLVLGILKACLHISNLELGKQFHCLLLKSGCPIDRSLSLPFMDFYEKFGCLEEANSVFNQLQHHDTDIWTVKIVNRCNQGRFIEAIEDFKDMVKTGTKMKSLALSTVLRACGGLGEQGGKTGKQVHAFAIKLGLERDGLIQGKLIDMYGKCGMVRDAETVFELNDNRRNAACWNALLMGHVRNGLHIDAVKVLYLMEAYRIKVDEKVIDRVRIACS